MQDAEGLKVTLDTQIQGTDQTRALFRTVGKSYPSPGFRLAYVESQDELNTNEADGGILPTVKQGAPVEALRLVGVKRETHPPARLTEATLVKELESRGIGRPSTYASIIETIQARKYVFKKGTALIPTWTAFAVTQLLEQHFEQLVDYEFTARLENGLDSIAMGQQDPVNYLASFYTGPEAEEKAKSGLVELIDKAQTAADSRTVCSISIGEVEGQPVVARVGRYGPYVEHNGETRSIPEELPPDELKPDKAISILRAKQVEPTQLGEDPATKQEVTIRFGRFGAFIQMGEGKGSKRAALLKNMAVEDVDLETALKLLALPRVLGVDDAGTEILAMNGRYGPFVKAGEESRSIPEEMSVLTIGIAEAKELLAQPARRKSSGAVLREVGEDPQGRKVVIKSGRFGVYVTDGEVNVTLKKQADPAELALEAAVEMLAAKHADPNKKTRGRRRRSSKKS